MTTAITQPSANARLDLQAEVSEAGGPRPRCPTPAAQSADAARCNRSYAALSGGRTCQLTPNTCHCGFCRSIKPTTRPFALLEMLTA